MQALYNLLENFRKNYLSKIHLPNWATESTEGKIVFGTLSFLVATFLLLTSFIWFPVVFFLSLPFFLAATVFIVVYYYIYGQVTAAKYTVKASLTTFNILNDVLTLVYPKSFLTVATVGYSDNSPTGVYLEGYK